MERLYANFIPKIRSDGKRSLEVLSGGPGQTFGSRLDNICLNTVGPRLSITLVYISNNLNIEKYCNPFVIIIIYINDADVK